MGSILLLLGLVGGIAVAGTGRLPATAQSDSRFFPATGHTIQGRFLAYWEQHGGLAQQGYPLTEEGPQVSPLDGKTYIMQYFERAGLEHHPENAPPYDVLLSQLGTFRYRQRYPGGAPAQQPSLSNPRSFAATGHTVGGIFRAYWEQHGGLAQQGYPLSDEFQEQSDLDGQIYTVQYFERAVFEWHPANQPPYDVLLSQLGTYRLAIARAQQAAAKLPSPPRIYAAPGSAVTAWPADPGSVVTYYSTCGVQPALLLGAPAAIDPCEAPMTLTTQLAPAGPALDVTFLSSWDNGVRHHRWQIRVDASGSGTLVQESGDALPILPQ
ncbi:MAG TPA: hypothetical protein VKY74_15450 [Chloroflexia bacterium]|nr:hypothetical protein [Chloroflexia bacterium]